MLLVGAEFRQLLLDCVTELNNAGHCDVSSDTTRPCHVESHCVLASDTDNASDVDSSSVISSVVSVSATGHTTAADKDKILCTEYEQYSGETAGGGVTGNVPVWTMFIEHYVKLGETHAYIFGFTKIGE